MAKPTTDRDVTTTPKKKKAKTAKKKAKGRKATKKSRVAGPVGLQIADAVDVAMREVPPPPLPILDETLEYAEAGAGFVVSDQFVSEFLRYTDAQFVAYDRFPALVQHILLMRRHVAM